MSSDASPNYSRFIHILAWSLAGVGFLLGVAMAVFLVKYDWETSQKNMKGVILAPFLAGGAAYLLGMSLAFLFAPTTFLVSDAGQKWLARVGTDNPATARVICGVVAVLIFSIYGFMIWALAAGKF